MQAVDRFLAEYPVVIEFSVAWGDMDAFQHVNNVMYFKYFESARIAYFEKIRFIEFMEEEGIGPILASTQCKYKIPLTYPDTISIGARVKDVGEDRFLMEYAVFSHNHEKIAALGDGLLVSFDYKKGAKTPLPDEIRKRIASLEEDRIDSKGKGQG